MSVSGKLIGSSGYARPVIAEWTVSFSLGSSPASGEPSSS